MNWAPTGSVCFSLFKFQMNFSLFANCRVAQLFVQRSHKRAPRAQRVKQQVSLARTTSIDLHLYSSLVFNAICICSWPASAIDSAALCE